MNPNPFPRRASHWLLENGPRQLEILSRTIAFSISAPIDALPPNVLGQASYLLDGQGFLTAWYPGAERLYGYTAEEAVGRHVSYLHGGPDATGDACIAAVNDELSSTSAAGHLGNERLQRAKGGSSFWANTITLALRNDRRELEGFAGVVRDFSDFHNLEEKLERSRARKRSATVQKDVASIFSGEFQRLTDANDVFLNLVGYDRKDFAAGVVTLAALTSPDSAVLDLLAHEEVLKFGACTPYEKELIKKDGEAVRVLVATALLELCPFRWITFVRDLRERNRAESVEQAAVELEDDFEEMVGKSASLKRIQRQIEMVAPTDATVLILGETGTGKELIARAIHRMSLRRHFPCVTLNCAAIPTGLLESELFGYERGAFTGALSQKIGRFEMAHNGTLFLDEVGDIPIDLQPKLLRALQEKSFERLGGTKTIPIDVRLVAATNRNLTQMMGDKLFRSDLYYRLKVFPITAPPLRARPEDIPLLVRHFTQKYSSKMNRQIDKIPSQTMQALTKWSWPGNIRELENFIERAVILSSGPNLRAPLSEIAEGASASAANSTLEQVERDYIIRVFRESGGVVTNTAMRLGLHRTTLNAMMRKLGISRRDL